jgi:DNA-binding MarR family transcriptional regulator
MENETNVGSEGESGSKVPGNGAEQAHAAFADPATYDRWILKSLRRIVRAVDLYSRELRSTCGLTVPQLVCLATIVREGQITAVSLSFQIHVSASTLVGILDRLEKRKLIERVRSRQDRRQVIITATAAGEEEVRRAPSPLQESLVTGLRSLSSERQAIIAQSLDKVVELMEAKEIKVAPLLTLERKSYAVAPGGSPGLTT